MLKLETAPQGHEGASALVSGGHCQVNPHNFLEYLTQSECANFSSWGKIPHFIPPFYLHRLIFALTLLFSEVFEAQRGHRRVCEGAANILAYRLKTNISVFFQNNMKTSKIISVSYIFNNSTVWGVLSGS